MSDVNLISSNSCLKRSNCDEDKTLKDEPPLKSQRLYLPINDDQYSQGPVMDSQLENYEITEDNYNKIVATTLYKKLQVLEIRDRLLRSATTQPNKDINVDEIQPIKGTCLDMCPEKERLLRIHGNMVSQFECKKIDSKLEPVSELMVKQYARSSADQANALSHELRPTHVLLNTMNYMLKNIIQPIESNSEQDLASWYDFCWDRLRAIRKDIVQQNLQNSEVVTILEQIGRFHIACYDLMLGYPGFDIKLNTENLNNCIQMLMPMYRDSDHQCPNEPEFVSYELLMHLGNPQFHTAYDLLPIHIKQSPQVRFCIKAHTIYLQSSDCIEFFKLLRSTTFMNCCILQRVIPSIRYNNIKMMNMSYTTVKRVYKLELIHVMKILCFDNIGLIKEFCSDINLKCDDIYVELSRKIAIDVPELRRPEQESVILQKRQNLTFLISETQNLPDVVTSVHSSFDENNQLNDPVNNELNKDLHSEILEPQIERNTYSSTNSIDSINKNSINKNSINKNSINKHRQFLTNPIQNSIIEIPTVTFNLPKSSLSTQVQTSFSNFEKPTNTLSTCFDVSTSVKSNLPTGSFSPIAVKVTSSPIPCNHDMSIKLPSLSPKHLSPLKSPYKLNFNKKLQFTQLSEKQIDIAKKYVCKWQYYVTRRKSKQIEEVFAHSELFHSEFISSLSSSPSSVKSFNYFNDYDVQEESRDWQHKQFSLAEKYFYIWLRKMFRKRRKIEIDPGYSMPWSVFMQVHGTPIETLQSMTSHSKTKEAKRQCLKLPIHPLYNNENKDDDISNQIAEMFVKNILDTKVDKLFGNKIFWKLAVNYSDSPDRCCIENKVQTIIYGKLGFSNSQVQKIYTDYNTYFIKSVQSCVKLHDWTASGLNAALVFTNTNKEDMEMLFKRVDSILQSTPISIPLVMILSSSSNINEIENYKSVLDAYRENDYINYYSIYVWEGPKTILESLEFFSKHYVDIAPGMRSEKLFYNMLRFAQSFFLKVRNTLAEDNPNTIIEKYNQYLDAYIKRLGRNNHILKDIAPEFAPYYCQNPEEFSKNLSNLNLQCFEDTLNDAHLKLYECWPPQNVDDLIDYVKNMCRVTNRRCWCLDILQMLQLHRNADLDYCLLNANWYEIIEMWILGALEKCSAKRDNFTVFYNQDPITDVLKTVFPDC